MTKEDYKTRFTENDAPGWMAIDQKIAEVYPKHTERHYGPLCGVHFQAGGEDPIDGTSIYDAKAPEFHRHIISYGMSTLYYDEEKAGEAFSKWGFEFTFRLKQNLDDADPIWSVQVMNNLARYVYQSGRWFEPNHFIPANGPIKLGAETLLTGFVFAVDPTLGAIQTPHGEVTFLQLVGITSKEEERIRNSEDVAAEVEKIISEIKVDNPLLITDLNRTKEYLG